MSKLFLGGVPTGPDVQRLLDTYGTPDEGTEITYDEIGAVIGEPTDSSRFRTVLNAWKKKLLSQHNVCLGHVNGVGVVVLTPAQRADDVQSRFVSGARKIGRTVPRLHLIPVERVDETTRHRIDHMKRVIPAVAQSISTSARDLANSLKAPKQLNELRAKPESK